VNPNTSPVLLDAATGEQIAKFGDSRAHALSTLTTGIIRVVPDDGAAFVCATVARTRIDLSATDEISTGY
jgi:hypothetical protein